MTITASATALLGLTAVVIGQIAQSGLHKRGQKWLKITLSSTFLLGILAIIFAIDWFFDPEAGESIVALIFFSAQLSVFSGTVVAFWLKA